MKAKDIYCYYINPDKNTTRREKIEPMLKSLGFKGLVRVNYNAQQANKVLTMTSAHLIALGMIKEAELFPALLLEDDAALMAEFPDLKQEGDLVYLGGSSYQEGRLGRIRKEHFSDNYFRVYNMLSAHAILIWDKKGVEIIETAYNAALQSNDFNDIYLALFSEKFDFLIPKSGFVFYQEDYTREVTKIKVDDI